MSGKSQYSKADDGLEAFETAAQQELQNDGEAHGRIKRKADAIVMPVMISLRFFARTHTLTDNSYCAWCTRYSSSTVSCIGSRERVAIDREGTSLSYASVMGMLKDLDLHGQQYSWLSSAFFICEDSRLRNSVCRLMLFTAYLVVEIPSGRLLQRFSPGKYTGTCAILWGVSCASFAAVNDFRSAVALRVVLGAFEACVSPALILIVSQVTRSRLRRRR